MSRRKRNNALPERLVNGRIRQLSWNMTSYSRLGALNNDCIFVPSSSNECDIDKPNNQSSSTEIEKDDSTAEGEASINDTFYKLTIFDELFVNSSTSLLGCLLGVYVKQDCFEATDRQEEILESNTVIKVCKAVGEDSLDGISKTFEENFDIYGKGFVKVIATYEQIDGLAYLQRKGIVEVVVTFVDLVNQPQCKLMVYLNEAGFSKINVPSEDPSMGKLYKSMKILMQWLHGPWLPDIQQLPNKHYDNQIESIFDTLKSKQSCPLSMSVNENSLPGEQIFTKATDLDKLQHPCLVPLLRAYQKRAVYWMIEQETVDTEAFATENKIPHPLWKTISVGEKQACYNPHTGRMSKDQIYHQGYPSGGILADEMGLGKTVEVLACILNNPKKSEVEMKRSQEIIQAERSSSPNESLICSKVVSDEEDSSMKHLSGVNTVDNHRVSPAQFKTIQVDERQEQSLSVKVERQLGEESKENGVKSDFLASNLPSFKEISSNNTKSAIEASVNDYRRGSSETRKKNLAGELNKRPLQLDPEVSIGKHTKKAKICENSNASSMDSNVHEQSAIFRETIQPYVLKSSLPSDAIISNVAVNENIVEYKDSLTHLVEDTNGTINYESSTMIDNTKKIDAVVPNDGPTKNLSSTAINDIVPDGMQKVQSIEYKSESKLSVVNDEEEKTVRCICGKNKAGCQEEVLTCTNCTFSQHPKCIGLKKETDENYVCPECSLKMPLLESNATLIVSPVTIAHQWLDEIHRHILPGSLNVMIYEGVAQQGFVYPSVLAENDIILTTYEVLKRDFHHLSSKKDNHNYRRPKRYSTWPCPLTGIKFWRICLDEAQMVENTTAKTTETALHLSAVHRWCITGTPIQKTIDDLRGLFLFLGVEPYYRKAWWKKLLYEPFMKGDTKPLSDVLYNVMWRTAKKDVIDEINLPEQKESMNWLNFSPVEYHFYRRQYEECSSSALKVLNKFQESETELNSLDRYSVHRVLWPLLKLRQACCHPQAVRGGYLAVQKNLITMDQLLESLINKAKIESQDAHRQLLCALNGLAGTYILQENWQSAVDVYREAIASWKEHEELFKTDTLQKLHTLHNLHEVLSKFNSNTRTLRDDFLEQEASEIKSKYLQKWKDQLTIAENEASSARNAHEELKLKVDFKCPWWMTYLQNIIDSENKISGDKSLSERLVQKVKSDLSGVTNQQEYGSLSMVDSFSDLRGLQLLLVQKFEAMEDCQSSLFRDLKNLMLEPTKEMVVATAECCLRPVTNNTAESCYFCQTNDIMSVYESLIFGHQGISNNDAESVGGLRAETEAVRTLKSIYAFLKSQSKHHDQWHRELQQQAQCHLEYLDLIRKNFKVYRQLWHALRQRVSALDELAMCTMRLRLRYPGEVVEDNQLYIVQPTEVESTQMGFRSDKVLALSSLRKSLGQLLYLKNLAKTQSTDDGENSELCPVCTKILGYQWSVFSCGHCLCCQCMWVLLERPGIPGRTGSYVRCPMCRANTMVQDISYVSTVRQLTEEDKDLVVKGSHSTKIEAAVRTLMKIQKSDPQAKTLVFSTWQDVLDVIACALAENNMKFRSIKKSKDFQSNLEEFKSSDDISILLIPLQSGSNGLNIIEATHVILVEPSLNPSLERQAVGRIHRIGQTKPTFIHRLLIANTVEEKIMRFLQNKADSGLRCGTRRTDGENIPLTVGELASFFQPTETQMM